MANAARAKGVELLRQIPKAPGHSFYLLHLTSRFDKTDPASFTVDAIAERCRRVKEGAKYLWNRVLKHAGAGFITGLEVAPGGMVHIHAIYFGRYQDVNVLRAAWLQKLPDSPQLVIEAIGNPETAIPEVFKYMMKLASPRNGKQAGWWMRPQLAARVEVALSGKRRSESYGAFRGVKLDDEPPEEAPLDLRCDACGNTERFGQAILSREAWQREHVGCRFDSRVRGLFSGTSREGGDMTTRPTEQNAANSEPLELPPKHTFKVVEEADILGLNQKTVRDQITTGQIRVIRIGRAIRIPRSEVLKLLGD
jgi:excisionase family DNA binding protein